MKISREPSPGRLALLCAMVLAPTPATAVVIQVATTGVDQPSCGAVGSPCATLGYAIDLATVIGPGDSIELAAGTYTISANINVDKSGAVGEPLVITGAGPTTMIDGADINGGDARGLTVSADHVVVSDMSLTNSPGAPLRITGSSVEARDLEVSAPNGNGKPCVEVASATDALLVGVRIHTCPGDGANITGSAATTLRGVEVSAAQNEGVRVSSCTATRLEGIWVHDNGLGGTGAALTIRLSDDFALTGGADDLPSSSLASRAMASASRTPPKVTSSTWCSTTWTAPSASTKGLRPPT